MKFRVLFLSLFVGLIVPAIMLAGMPLTAFAAPETSNAAPQQVEYKIYVVKEGDTLGIIARKFNVTIAAIKKANNLGGGAIYVGQKLRIPVKSTKPQDNEQQPQQPSASPIKKRPNRPAGFRPPNARKWIEVDLSQQRLYAHENGQIVFTTLISSGRSPYHTPIGRFRVWAKVRRQTMSGPGYRLPNVQWVMYFAGENAIHGTYWHNNFGHPMSHGCVNATNKAARWLYNWAPYGTIVVVHR
ncbi:MAG TPA: LysM peptidoglycan-binding domain-containing protein [Anaerolineae bacterium]|nr:LysM peptidoglycan-binding domain-containing protein [Anaerolineae bacterium]